MITSVFWKIHWCIYILTFMSKTVSFGAVNTLKLSKI